MWFADGPEGHAASLRIGQSITVWYETDNPSRSCSCSDPYELRRDNNDLVFLGAVAFLVVTAAFLAIASRTFAGDWLAFIESAQSFFNSVGSRSDQTGSRS